MACKTIFSENGALKLRAILLVIVQKIELSVEFLLRDVLFSFRFYFFPSKLKNNHFMSYEKCHNNFSHRKFNNHHFIHAARGSRYEEMILLERVRMSRSKNKSSFWCCQMLRIFHIRVFQLNFMTIFLIFSYIFWYINSKL